jgi:hypothetical protein
MAGCGARHHEHLEGVMAALQIVTVKPDVVWMQNEGVMNTAQLF